MENSDDSSKVMADLDQEIVSNDNELKSSDADMLQNHPSTVNTTNQESNLYSQG